MNFPIFINKFVLNFKPIQRTPFFFWFRLTNHDGWRLDDNIRYWDFWNSINQGILDMNYKWEFEKFWGRGAEPETIVLPEKDFDALVEMLELPSEATIESVKRLMKRRAPWDD